MTGYGVLLVVLASLLIAAMVPLVMELGSPLIDRYFSFCLNIGERWRKYLGVKK